MLELAYRRVDILCQLEEETKEKQKQNKKIFGEILLVVWGYLGVGSYISCLSFL